MSILIFSRPIRSGKTTELLHWCRKQSGVQGIAMPDVNEVRMMMNLAGGQIFEAQCITDTDAPLITIGPFRFFAAAFEKANEILLQAAAAKPNWLVVDEVGKLELLKQGFYPAVKELVDRYQPDTENNRHLLLVIRDSLVEQLISFLGIKNPVRLETLQEYP